MQWAASIVGQHRLLHSRFPCVHMCLGAESSKFPSTANRKRRHIILCNTFLYRGKAESGFYSSKHRGFLATPDTLLHLMEGTERWFHTSPEAGIEPQTSETVACDSKSYTTGWEERDITQFVTKNSFLPNYRINFFLFLNKSQNVMYLLRNNFFLWKIRTFWRETFLIINAMTILRYVIPNQKFFFIVRRRIPSSIFVLFSSGEQPLGDTLCRLWM